MTLQKSSRGLGLSVSGGGTAGPVRVKRLFPQQPAALFFLGVAHLVQGRAQEAVKPLELAANNRPEASIETHLGMALRECGRVAEALTWLERATSRWPIFAPAFKELGVTYRKMRRFADAEAILRRGQELAPPMPDLAFRGLGYAVIGLLLLTMLVVTLISMRKQARGDGPLSGLFGWRS